MSTQRTVEDKLKDWATAYVSIRDSLTPAEFRPMLALMQTPLTEDGGVQSINIGIGVARLVFANDRAAATVASLLTANGVKPVDFDFGDDLS